MLATHARVIGTIWAISMVTALLWLTACKSEQDHSASRPKSTVAPPQAETPKPTPIVSDVPTSHPVPTSAKAPVPETETTATLAQAMLHNALGDALSPYLRSQTSSPVCWQPWSAETFAGAQQLGRPIFLSIGASWSYASRLQDATLFASPEVARALRDGFVAVKVDADERPDIAERYASAHRLIHQDASELPIIAFLLEDGRPFESVATAPNTPSLGPEALLAVLAQVRDLYTGQRPKLERQAETIERALAAQAPDPNRRAELNSTTFRKAYETILSDFASPPVPGMRMRARPYSVLFLLHCASDGVTETISGDPSGKRLSSSPLDLAARTLTSYYKSALRDCVLGGYFAASFDSAFAYPDTAKLLPDQAAMLRAFATAHAATGRQLFRDAAFEILRYCRDSLERSNGGFYASQEGEPPNQQSRYYSCSADEIRKLVGEDRDAEIFIRYFNVASDEPTRRCYLRPTRSLQAIANEFKITYDAAQQALDRVRTKLREARMEQEDFPLFNKALIASWNAYAVTAYLDAYRYLGDVRARDFALMTMDVLLAEMISETEGVAHIYARGKRQVYGLLEDHVAVAHALVQCFQVSGKHEYLETAESLMAFIEANFADEATGLYRDRSKDASQEGLLRLPRYYVFDTVLPSPNAQAASIWMDLHLLTGKASYKANAKRLLEAVAAQDNFWRVEAGACGQSLLLAVNGAPKVVVVGEPENPLLEEMRKAALSAFRMGSVVETLSPEAAQKTDYLPSKDGKPIAYVCTLETCAPPVREPQKLAETLRNFGRTDHARTGSPASGSLRPAEPQDQAR